MSTAFEMNGSMTLIPVIDLLKGRVVRGVRGDRQAYRPIESALCASSDPLTVAKILVDHCAARQLYVADLDALTGGTPQHGLLRELLGALDGIELWVDAGFADADAAASLAAQLAPHSERIVPVFASESLRSRAALEDCCTRFGTAGAVLSLDRREGKRLDPAGCWDAVSLWPQRVIVMTLERVGSGAGPDLETMAALHRVSPGTTFVGAGGVRSSDDLACAHAAGAGAWLVASALHDLQLPRQPR
ncbi:HisA/HisF-related TIM barrel protein [Ideonella sp.]|uniref:HisA/HisF-related TIM barrel protein n=1 Tax=Ideonella sp. TaxID=1929293 RepID=UPI00351B98D5